jgi:spore maturation protein CgeB
MGRIYSGHKVSLNIHADVVRRGTNMRTFECAAYGIPQLIEDRPGLEAFFSSGDEIATFVEVEELQERLVRLLSDPVSASAMALRARRRVFKEHSYHHRCVALLEGVLPAKLLQGRLAALTRSGGVLELPC